MKQIVYSIFLLLMLIGNCFGLYQVFTGKQVMISRFPKMNDSNYFIIQLLPVVNIVALTGMLFFQRWSPWLAIIGAVILIASDVYFRVHYHLYLAVPATIILLFFIFKYWDRFQ